MEKDRRGKTTLRDRARRLAANGAGELVGNLVLAGGRARARLHDHRHDAERIVRWASQPDAGLLRAGRLARSRLLTGTEMDQITVGSAGAISGAEAHALGSVSQATASTSALVASGSRTIAGAPFQNAEASGSSDVFADGKNGGVQIASKATAIGAGGGTSHAQVDMHFSAITTNRADLVFGSVTAIACCAPLAEAQIAVTGRAGGPYSRELQGAPPSDTPGQTQRRVDIFVTSSALPTVDPGRMLGLLTPRGSPQN